VPEPAAEEDKGEENLTLEGGTTAPTDGEDDNGKVQVAAEDVAAAFTEADKDGSGSVSMEEIQAIEVKFGLPIEISIKSADWEDGKINLEEFTAMLEANGNLKTPPAAEEEAVAAPAAVVDAAPAPAAYAEEAETPPAAKEEVAPVPAAAEEVAPVPAAAEEEAAPAAE
jgi:hypothetical protein